jgi:hypothetical protein
VVLLSFEAVRFCLRLIENLSPKQSAIREPREKSRCLLAKLFLDLRSRAGELLRAVLMGVEPSVPMNGRMNFQSTHGSTEPQDVFGNCFQRC